jgi:small-conductance mechanosensitive channel
MKLNEQHIAILRVVREVLEESPEGGYICHLVADEVLYLRRKELNRWRNRIFFWRKMSILEKWQDIHHELWRAIQFALDGRTTVGQWFEDSVRRVGVNFSEGERHNRYLYKQIRLAWLDRALETGELK